MFPSTSKLDRLNVLICFLNFVYGTEWSKFRWFLIIVRGIKVNYMKNLDLVLLLAEFFSDSANFSFQSSATIDSRAPIFGVPAHNARPVHHKKFQLAYKTNKNYRVSQRADVFIHNGLTLSSYDEWRRYTCLRVPSLSLSSSTNCKIYLYNWELFLCFGLCFLNYNCLFFY